MWVSGAFEAGFMLLSNIQCQYLLIIFVRKLTLFRYKNQQNINDIKNGTKTLGELVKIHWFYSMIDTTEIVHWKTHW